MNTNETRSQPSPPLNPRDLSAHYRALADATRLRVIRALWQRREGTVTDLCQELRVSQPLMSWHLRILRRAGLVTTHRTGRQVHCTVTARVLEENGTLLSDYLTAQDESEGAAPAPAPKPAAQRPRTRTVPMEATINNRNR